MSDTLGCPGSYSEFNMKISPCVVFMLRFMVNMKTSLAAQRTETFEEQGFKNIFVKVFFTKT